jgi:penicillin-binding protein 2
VLDPEIGAPSCGGSKPRASSSGRSSLCAIAYWYVQIARGEHYYTLSENNRIRSVRTMAPRGYVLDRHGSILVDNQPGYTLYLYRREARNLEASIDFAAGVLKVPREQVRMRVQRGLHDPEFLPITVAENLGIEDVAAIEARAPEHPEFVITVAQRRLYTLGTAAAHALGYLSEASPEQIKGLENGYRLGDWMGQKGIEGSYEKLLAGVDGQRRVVVDSHGREITEEERVEARPGQNVFLTLDLGLQRIAEDFFKDKVGSAVAMDPKTGEILALVSSPSYDPNWFTRRVSASEWAGLLGDRHNPLQNRAMQNAFSPGSVFKVFLAYGALAHGLVDPAQKVFCPGQATFYGRTFHCHNKTGHGWVNLRDAIKVSCDVYFYTLGRRLGIDRISEIARAFGFGARRALTFLSRRRGLSLPRSGRGQTARALVPGARRSRSRLARGRCSSRRSRWPGPVGARQRGRPPTPHLFLASQDPKTGAALRYRGRRARGCRWTPRGRGSCSRGCGPSSTRPGARHSPRGSRASTSAARQGTTQVVGREAVIRAGADRGALGDHAWFAGFATLDDPRLVVAVFVENGGHGGAAAAPLARQLFAKRFGKLLPPEPRKDVVAEIGNRKSEIDKNPRSATARFPIADSRFPAQRDQTP